MQPQQFLNEVFGEDFWCRGKDLRQELRARLEDRIPVFGWVYQYGYRRTDREPGFEELDFRQIDIYLAGQDGKVWKPDEDIAISRREPSEFASYIAEILGIPEAEIELLHGKLKTEPNESGYYDTFSWKIAYVPEASFSAAYENFQVSIVADTDSSSGLMSEDAHRVVFPHAVVVKDAEFEFPLEEAQVQFVKSHKYCAEYVTPEGMRIFDHRREWWKALRGWVETIQTKRADDPRIRFAWRMLYAIANAEIDNHDDKFGEGLQAFTGTRLIPADELFAPCRVEKRIAFKDAHWSGWDRFDFDVDVFNPRYVIIRNPRD